MFALSVTALGYKLYSISDFLALSTLSITNRICLYMRVILQNTLPHHSTMPFIKCERSEVTDVYLISNRININGMVTQIAPITKSLSQ